MANPIVKWAGGKRKQAGAIVDSFPKDHRSYCEPFLGGAAVFLEWQARGGSDDVAAMLSDSLPCLIGAYHCIAGTSGHVDRELSKLAKAYAKDPEGTYYRERERFQPYAKSDMGSKEAARFFFLNRTCFNGLFRTNAKGEFNTPFGKYTDPKIDRPEEHREFASALLGRTLRCLDFEDAIDGVDEEGLVYCDPPYWPVENGGFTAYTSKKFDTDEQVRLAKCLGRLSVRGGYFAASNVDLPEVRALYREHCEGVRFIRMEGRRNINRDGFGREPIAELLIVNY